MNITWDADLYASNFEYILRYGAGVQDLIDAEKGASVLDLGCGNCDLTAALLEKGYVPQGLDASPELLAAAKENHPDIPVIQGDATDFTLEEPVDVIFSNAVFHWIDERDQDKMLRCVYNALKDDGQFVFEFGGYGNNNLIHNALDTEFSHHGYEYHMPFYFPSIGAYATRLERAGFKVTYATLFDRPTELFSNEGMSDWIHMFVQTPFENVPEEEKESIIQGAVERLRYPLKKDNVWYADYVRLRMKAVKD